MKNVYEIRRPKIKKFVKQLINLFGFEIKKKNNWFDKHRDSVVELDSNLSRIIKKTDELINASMPNRWAIIQSLVHIKKLKVPGDIVETGVFHGGGLIFINEIIKYLKLNKRIWGYDTFGGVPNINLKFDKILGEKKINIINNYNQEIYPNINIVIKNLSKSIFKYKPLLIKGDTRETLKNKKNIPKKISFIRLDTDFYESTLNELKTFYPLVSKNGVVMIDDYGHHQGCRKAVDEYFKNKNVWLHRVDYTARLIVKK